MFVVCVVRKFDKYFAVSRIQTPRCTPMKFNCPFCHEEFVNKNNFDIHMNNHDENSYEGTTQLSTSEDSLWKYSLCKLCGEKFDNELDVKEHMDKMHITNIRPDNLYGRRIKQNLRE